VRKAEGREEGQGRGRWVTNNTGTEEGNGRGGRVRKMKGEERRMERVRVRRD